jgi:Protein of unknown function (DUF3455)
MSTCRRSTIISDAQAIFPGKTLMRKQNPNFPSFAAALSLWIISACASAPAQAGSQVPDLLRVPDASVLVLKAHGAGTQIYECKSSQEAATPWQWVLKAPLADLLDDQGKKVGKHYGGPTWEATDGSQVVGELQQHVAATSPDAIPWLLLKAKSNQGTGMFKDVSYIQRLETKGGKAPSSGCDAEHAGGEARIPYSAEYVFYR